MYTFIDLLSLSFAEKRNCQLGVILIEERLHEREVSTSSGFFRKHCLQKAGGRNFHF